MACKSCEERRQRIAQAYQQARASLETAAPDILEALGTGPVDAIRSAMRDRLGRSRPVTGEDKGG